MGTVRMDAAAVRAKAGRVLECADRLDEIRWPTLASDALVGSAVSSATALSSAEDGLADVVTHLRSWATAARAAATAVEQAESRHADGLGESR
jgi:hypothetical protein